jgi:hypothetical protein
MFAGTADGLKRALRDLEAGLDILGGNVLLYQGMAEAHLQHYEYGIKADEEILQQLKHVLQLSRFLLIEQALKVAGDAVVGGGVDAQQRQAQSPGRVHVSKPETF